MHDPAPGFLIWCPFPAEDEARAVAASLLDEGLIACANIIPGMVSLYTWQGTRGEGREVGMLCKTHGALAEQAMDRLEQLHSYATPAIIGWPSGRVAAGTGEWLAGLVSTEAGS